MVLLMSLLEKTDFSNPSELVLDFIKSSSAYSKQCSVGPKGDSKECLKVALDIIHHYTYFKFHQYKDYRSGLNAIKNAKEIDCIEYKSKRECLVYTKKNLSVLPECVFTLICKNKKWKIDGVHKKNGNNTALYQSLFD
jgi:hypothetical protein